ncbi:MAG: putative permease [Paenibacillus sp.]|jgi:uncharacterized membrane protein YfcA|nr:putative permease [Paenibacillus sp.]
MDMEISLIVLLIAIGVAGSFVSGMVGIGGAIIQFPLLLYVPGWFGFEPFTVHEVSAITAVQVFFSTLSGMLVHQKSGYVHKPLVLVMGAFIIAGSFIGGYGSRLLADAAVTGVYGVLAVLAAVMMLLPKRKEVGGSPGPGTLSFNKPLAAALAGTIGIASGIVGAAGAFITVPIMLVVLKIPTRVAIASSMAITFISSIGSATGKLLGGHMPLVPVIVMVAASLLASPLGAAVSKRLNTVTLQWILSALISATVIKIGYGIFF